MNLGPPTLRLLAAAAASAVAFGLTWLVFVRSSTGQLIDGRLLPRSELGGGYAQDTVLLGPAARVLGRFGNPLLIGALVLGIVVLALMIGRFRAGLAGAIVVLGSAGAAGLAKQSISRPELGVIGSSTHNSFPSGHVAIAAGLLLGFLLVVPARLRWWVAVPGATGVSVIAAATMVAGWHRFSDVAGSLLLVATVFFVVASVLARWPGRRGAEDPTDNWSGFLSLAIGQTLLMMALLAIAPDAGLPLLAAIATAGGLTILVVWAALHLIGPPEPEPDDRHDPAATPMATSRA
ncbi:PAP2 superfamily protein [Asanoa ishikariensis]|uniref:PAP2 superfamily protein n=1 Tax=Asanoa ishikariensis TaxID=137265 RepID=A0A1H3TW75_9ACTN|nr:phosphatase PAP2 family protein [Asanoa ishikariensis]SDZ54474.1 PAP2 superfamily protein [Asanoa ishikariensis]